MRYVSVRELRNTPAAVWSALEEGELVLTSNGGPVALLLRVDENDVEDTLALVRRARAQQAVSRLRQDASRTGTSELTMDEIEAEIHRARGDRKAT